MTDDKSVGHCKNILYAGPKPVRNILTHLSPNRARKPGPTYNSVNSHHKTSDRFYDLRTVFYKFGSSPLTHIKTGEKFMTGKNVPILDWSGNSPDVNQIEHLWATSKSSFSWCKLDDYGKAHSGADSRMVQGSENYQSLFKTSRLYVKQR